METAKISREGQGFWSVKRIKTDIYWFYALLLAITILVPTLNRLICLLIVMINVVRYNSGQKEGALLSTFILPGDVYPLISVFVFLVFEMSTRKKRITGADKWYSVAFITILGISFACAAKYNTFINVAVSSCYLILFFLIVRFMENILDVDKTIYHLKRILGLEFFLSLVIIVQQTSVRPGDINRGSMGDAHWFGFWLVVSGLSLWTYSRKFKKLSVQMTIRKNLVLLFMIAFMLYLSEAKAIILCGIMAVFLVLFFKSFGEKKIIPISIIGVVFVLYIFIILIDVNVISDLVVKLIPYESMYIFSPEYNQKYMYFSNTLMKELRGIRFLFGYGLGQYGSRFSNLFIFESISRRGNFLNNFIRAHMSEHMIPEYFRNISYYNNDFVAQIPYRSAILSYPYSGVIALLAETGVIGLIIYILVAQRLFKDSFNKVVFVFFFIACIFDMYFDDFSLMAYPLILLLNFKLVSTRIYKN